MATMCSVSASSFGEREGAPHISVEFCVHTMYLWYVVAGVAASAGQLHCTMVLLPHVPIVLQ